MIRLLAACAALLAWSSRNLVNADGVSYLDIAAAALANGPLALIDGYWSPMYPALLAVTLGVVRPGAESEFAVVHGVNWLLAVGCLWAFRRLLRNGIPAPQPPWFAWVVCFWGLAYWITLAEVTPDMLVAFWVLLIAGSCCRLESPRDYALMGLMMGASYYAKAAMFPACCLLLAILFVWPPTVRPNRRGLAVAGVVFLAVAAPLVAAMSARLGRPSIGAAGSLNYAWYVNGMQAQSGWVAADEHGTPTRPPRVVSTDPLAFVYDGDGTYPLWRDPSGWYQGARVRFHPSRLAVAIAGHVRYYIKILFVDMAGLVGGVVVLCWLARREGTCARPLGHRMWLALWPALVLALYACVHVEGRFLGAYLALFWVGLYGMLSGRVPKATESAVVVVALLGFAPGFALRALEDVGRGGFRAPDDFAVARELKGVERVATVGRPFQSYWARIGRMKVVGEVPDADAYWSAGDAAREAIAAEFARAGATALVARDKPRTAAAGRWRELLGTRDARYHALALSPVYSPNAEKNTPIQAPIGAPSGAPVRAR